MSKYNVTRLNAEIDSLVLKIHEMAVVELKDYLDSIDGYIDVTQIGEHLLRWKGRDIMDGFWIWDIPNNFEWYSPTFRSSLGFDSEEDFPNTPESWQKQILPASLELALSNFDKHVETKGVHPYNQIVEYYKKDMTSIVRLICDGTVVTWAGDSPVIMIGTHFNVD